MSLPSLKKLVRTGLACCGLALACLGPAQAAQSAEVAYPVRPVNMLLPFPAGGVTDSMMRKIADRFQAITGQTMIIQNRPGRTNALGALVKAEPDGYTLSLIGRSQMISHWMLGDDMPFDPVKDFTWIDTLVSSWFALLVNADSPIKSVDDLVAAARKGKDVVSFGSAFGVGGLTHAPMHDFARQANIEMLYVPYKGDAESIQALLSKNVDAIVSAGSAMPYVDSGRMRLLAWVSKNPHPKYPDVKPLGEMGYDVEAYSIVGLGGPKGMDPALTKKISGIFQQIIAEPETEEYLLKIFQQPYVTGPEQFTTWAENQLDKEREILVRFNLLENKKP